VSQRLLFILFLMHPAFAGAAESSDEEPSTLVSIRDKKILSVVFSGDPIPSNTKQKFLALEETELNPSAVRGVLLWHHDNGGDSLLEVSTTKSRGGLILRVHNKQRLKIAEIAFEGNETASSAVLLQQVELKVGNDFDPALVNGAVQKLSLFYSKQGYLASDVKASFDSQKHVLKFSVTEGEPTLLIGVSLSTLSTVERKDIRERYEKDLLDAFGLKAGDRIQRDKVLEGIQAIKDWLRERDFLMARDPVLDYKVGEDGRVELRLDIAYGSRIRYGFRGNEQFSYRELMALVSDVKEISTGSDYLSAVRRRVLEAYKEIGFANAKITTLVREDPSLGIRYVTLVVSEEKKILIEAVEIEGVFSMTKEEARSRFKKLGSRLVQRDYFHEAGINRAADLFAEELRSLGYLSAKLEYVKPDFSEDRKKVKVSILFSEGVQTRVQSVEVVGLNTFSIPEVREIFGLREEG